MKLLHTGDVHLDSAFCRYGALDAEALRERGRALLRRIFALAEEENCDMLLIAGDLFDSRTVTPETERLVCSLVTSFGKPVVVSPGNHDPYEAGSFYRSGALPENLYVFSSGELQCFDFPELSATVYGYAFLSPVFSDRPLMGAEAPHAQAGELRLLCAHGDLNDPLSRYAPITEGDLSAFSFDYAALGHVHNRMGSAGVAQYCGFAEGRGFDEEGEGGVLVVSLTAGEAPVIERRVVSRVSFRAAELDVSGCEDAEALEKKIRDFCADLGEDASAVHLRLTVTGMLPDGIWESLAYREGGLGEGFGSFELINRTATAPDGEYLMRDVTVRGAFYRALLDPLRSDDPEERRLALRALRIGLLAIDGKRFTDDDGKGGV